MLLWGILLTFVASVVGTLVWVEYTVLRFLRGERNQLREALRSAQVDVNLVRALRGGEIGLAELTEVGVLSTAEEEVESDAAPLLDASSAASPQLPRFVPSPYKRTPKVDHLDPGDEVWIDITEVWHDSSGQPVVWKNALTYCCADAKRRARLRVFEDGSLELGPDPKDSRHAGGRVEDIKQWRPIARVVELEV